MEQLLVFRNTEKVTQPLGIRISFSQFCELSGLVIEVLTKFWKELGFLASVLLAHVGTCFLIMEIFIFFPPQNLATLNFVSVFLKRIFLFGCLSP